MTTPYAVSTNIGSVSYNNYVNAPITGPLSTNQTPCQIPYHSYGTLVGIRPTPPQFYPSQEPVNADMNTNSRYRYLRANVSNQDLQKQLALGKASAPLAHFIQSTNRYAATSSHFNYIVPIPSSMRTDILKAKAVDKVDIKLIYLIQHQFLPKIIILVVLEQHLIEYVLVVAHLVKRKVQYITLV